MLRSFSKRGTRLRVTRALRVKKDFPQLYLAGLFSFGERQWKRFTLWKVFGFVCFALLNFRGWMLHKRKGHGRPSPLPLLRYALGLFSPSKIMTGLLRKPEETKPVLNQCWTRHAGEVLLHNRLQITWTLKTQPVRNTDQSTAMRKIWSRREFFIPTSERQGTMTSSLVFQFLRCRRPDSSSSCLSSPVQEIIVFCGFL